MSAEKIPFFPNDPTARPNDVVKLSDRTPDAWLEARVGAEAIRIKGADAFVVLALHVVHGDDGAETDVAVSVFGHGSKWDRAAMASKLQAVAGNEELFTDD